MVNKSGDAKSVFLAAIELDRGSARDRYLKQACEGNQPLRSRVDELIVSFEQGGDFMENHPAAALTPTAPIAEVRESAGNVIGRYKLLQQIGEGGFGVVYMAEQHKPVRRKVALKIIKPGMDTKEVIARFEAERQSLALMDHPNIAKVLDAGATESGRPYFVMELVKGVSLIEFCDNNDLSNRERLTLFTSICRAVQHAHQKGIIHRDLKPSNVMITMHDGHPVPKVIDFGVSKAISQQLTERTLFTAYGQMIGTPAYMSPEQAEMSGLDIDTRSDIYSLGVLLYELLTGSTPLQAERLRGTAYADIQRMIREEEPPKPSTRLSTLGDSISKVAHHRGTNPQKLSQFVRGDLDWIVMKSLEKDRNRRYETASGFAADIERFLAGEAIEARPPSVGYQLSKYARRHKALLATTSMVGLALVLGIIGTTWQAIRATAQRDRAIAAETAAEDESDVSRAVVEFVNRDLLARSNPHNEPDRNLKLTTVLRQASRGIEGRFKEQPKIEAAIRFTLGDAYLSLGQLDIAREHLERARDLHLTHHGAEHKDTLQVQTRCAWLEHEEGHMQRAEALLTQVIGTAKQSLGNDDPLTLDAQARLADILRHLGKHDSSEQLFYQTLDSMQRVLGPEHPQTLECRNDLALLYGDQGRLDEEAALHTEVLEICRRVLGNDHTRTIESIGNLAFVFNKQKKFREAEELSSEAIERSSRVQGEEHSTTLLNYMRLTYAARSQGRHDESIRLLREVLKIQNRTLPPYHDDTFETLNHIVNAYRSQDRFKDIVALYQSEIAYWQQQIAAERFPAEAQARLAETYRRLAWHHRSQDNYDQATTAFGQATALGEKVVAILPNESKYVLRLAVAHWNAAATHELARRPEAAKTSYERACRVFKQIPKQDLSAADWGHYGQMLYGAQRYSEARDALRRGIELRGDDAPNYRGGPRWWFLTMSLHRLGETDQARSYYDQLTAKWEADPKPPPGQESSRKETARVLGVELDSATANEPVIGNSNG